MGCDEGAYQSVDNDLTGLEGVSVNRGRFRADADSTLRAGETEGLKDVLTQSAVRRSGVGLGNEFLNLLPKSDVLVPEEELQNVGDLDKQVSTTCSK